MNSYVRGELKFEDDLPYEILTSVQPWDYGVHNNYASAGDKLASAMNQNPYMRVLVFNGRCGSGLSGGYDALCAGTHGGG